MSIGNKITNSRVLITGGAGFIGSNLCEALIDQQNEIVCLDNFSTGKRENIEDILKKPNFRLIDGDIRNLDTCKEACDGIDIILHQAALGSIPRSIDDPITTNEVNISGFLNMLVACKDNKVKRFVYASSSSTYGDHPDLPKVEDTIGTPLSPYAVTKYVNELYGRVFAELYDLEIIGLRYFNVFGPRQDSNGVYAAAIPRFVNTLINHESPKIFGDGTQSRDFTYIENVVQINQLAATTNNQEAFNGIYNVAFGESTTVNDLFTSIRDLLSGYDSEIGKIEAEHVEKRPGEVKHSLASIDKAKQFLGYSPSYGFSEGMAKAIPWYWASLNK